METRIIFLLFIMMGYGACGQSFSHRTNAVKLDLAREPNATTLPAIVWTFPRTEVSNSTEASALFEAEVRSSVALTSLRIELISGGTMKVRDIPVSASEQKTIVQQKITFVEGLNVVRLLVENEKGGVVSSQREVLFGKEEIADAVSINRKDYALLIATDNYDIWDDLKNPIHDATTIAEILKSKYNYETEVLLNPTNDEILAKITEYNIRRFNPQDQLFVFFAGHGTFDEDLREGYVVAANSLLNDKGRASYISHILIRERLNNIRCEHIFLMMDVCFGGTIDPILAKSRGVEDVESSDKNYLVKKLTRKTRKFLTSGSREYVSDGIEGKHSPFAEKFILALREIGGGSGRMLTLAELQTYFQSLASETRYGGFGNDDPASDFVFVARN